jgi:hypothetical protein
MASESAPKVHRGPAEKKADYQSHCEVRDLRRAKSIPQHLQSQGSLTGQLLALRVAAVRLGFYDADDWLSGQDI